MGRMISASLLIGVFIAGALLALYHYSGLFYDVAVWLEMKYHLIFRLSGDRELEHYLLLQYGFFSVMAFVSAWICIGLPGWLSRIGYIAGAVFLIALISPVLAFCGVLFEPLSAAVATVLAGIAGIIFGSTDEVQRGHRLMKYFVGRISKKKFYAMISAKTPAELGGKRELTVLSCRILNYPDLISHMEAADLEKMGSGFLRAAAEFLVSKGAYLDTCNAEGLRVFFGYTDKAENHALDGCHAALELRQRLINLEQEMQNRWHRKPIFGVALSSGPMSLGLYGFGEYQFYSAVGESVEFCRRLCGVNLVYGTRVLTSARTYQAVKEQMEARPMEMVYAPKLHQISEVYELLGEKGTLSEEETKARDAYWQGVIHLRKGAYKEAVELLKKSQIEGREDPPLKYFLERAEAGESGEIHKTETPGAISHVRVLSTH